MLYHTLPRTKHEREDGFLVELVSRIYPDEPFTCIHSYVVAINPGKSRAGHYHRKKDEWLCIVTGKIRLDLADLSSGTKESVIMDSQSKEYTIIHIPAGIAHLVTNTSGTEIASIIVFSTDPEDKEDTTRYDFSAA